ncbi:hypothetical protein MGYG_02126 [Nannizzia gypsea CBS 118893]|uniref:Uncharacterized protein n=1 Tax=Arthroderma gypseum (strain ATCC MYA-4604 / CBS 118893) TaxID=535722 RepID=E4UPX9_ARTGP|nr:hypothetical protein MGYG_02126 [Nannizzia gypsea CBS 118893]EFQ99113.1 hypothetical protein MGYG_02126 [Nannizzia gypsea CBS 118893]
MWFCEATRMKYRFSNRDNVPISSFLVPKVNLLREAGITFDDDIVHHIYDSLEPQLQTSRPIDNDYNDYTVEDLSRARDGLVGQALHMLGGCPTRSYNTKDRQCITPGVIKHCYTECESEQVTDLKAARA